jgi:kojibiose phosphorylase
MDTWHIVETAFDPADLHPKETVFTLGNGYLGTRGAFEEGYPGDRAITLVHGLFDDAAIVHTELVNAPNWLHLAIFVDGARFRLDRGEILAYRRTLALRTGVLTRTVRWRSPAGATVELAFERFASLADPHVLALRCRVTAVDFSGSLTVRAGLPGHVDNDGVLHWTWLDQGAQGAQGVFLSARTRHTHRELCEAGHLRVAGARDVAYTVQDCQWTPTVVAETRVRPGQTLTFDKLVTIYTDRDVASPRRAALDTLGAAVAQGYDALRAAHDAAWAVTWEACDVTIEGDDWADRALRYSLFQLLIVAPRHTERVSIPAKTLSGLGYRGHVFWDVEIFMLPFFTYTQPELARTLLLYRYRTLPGARRNAQEAGYEGAMYAWESALSGEETTPRWVPAPDGSLVRIWCGDIELHITADVAYAVMQYWRATGDDAFMRDYGAEIVLETARFWGSRAQWNPAAGVYEIHDVIGPDENHEHVDNNAYTNGMARWNLEAALEVLDWLRETYPRRAAELAVPAAPVAHWRDVIDELVQPYDLSTRLIEQFDGFFDLRDVDLADYEPRTQSMQALLGIEAAQAYQILKQPDVLMLLYLLDERYDRETLRANWAYYTPRTDLAYGSSLGPAIQAAVSARLGEVEDAYAHFTLAARTDLENARGNAGDGIHGATAGGLWQAVVFGFGGVRFTDGEVTAQPHLPPGWTRLRFRLKLRGRWHTFDFD